MDMGGGGYIKGMAPKNIQSVEQTRNLDNEGLVETTKCSEWILLMEFSIVLVFGLALVAIAFAAHIDLQPVAMNCDEPICINNETYYPDWDPYFYYECLPDLECGWSPLKRPCPPGALFSFEAQVCVGCDEWEDPCGVGPPPKTTTVWITF